MYIINNTDLVFSLSYKNGDYVNLDPCLVSDIFARTQRYAVIITASGTRYRLNAYEGIRLIQDGTDVVYYNAREFATGFIRKECAGGDGGTGGDPVEFTTIFVNATVFLVEHNLGIMFPDLQIVDQAENEIQCQVVYLDANRLRLLFNPAATGTVRCSH